jgi:hypothetical protein
VFKEQQFSHERMLTLRNELSTGRVFQDNSARADRDNQRMTNLFPDQSLSSPTVQEMGWVELTQTRIWNHGEVGGVEVEPRAPC